MASDTVTAVEVQETNYGEKVAITSPYEARDFFNALPFMKYSEEVEKYGSLRQKAEERGKPDADSPALDAVESYGFPDDFAAHASWDGNALGAKQGAWMVDVEALDETMAFLEFCGFDVEISDDINL